MAERIAETCNRPSPKARVRKSGWTMGRRRQFLNALAETCNVRHACHVAGMSQSSAYDLRRRDPAFADLWAEALSRGYEALEAALLSYALAGVNAVVATEPTKRNEADPAAVKAKSDAGFDPHSINAASIQLALTLLNRHRQAIEGRPGSTRSKRATANETDAALKKQLDALARKLNAGRSESKA